MRIEQHTLLRCNPDYLLRLAKWLKMEVSSDQTKKELAEELVSRINPALAWPPSITNSMSAKLSD
jgi:hypothetical protein